MASSVHQLNVSDGGVPKRPVADAFVNVRGLVGDRQADRKHHGTPDQALCLYSLEVIHALQEEGHPIEPGSAGENVTITGLDWAQMAPGVRLRIGADVVAELTWPASPCAKNSRWFADRDHHRIDHDAHPGWGRWYARVRAAGTVRTGDPVVVEDAPAPGVDQPRSRASKSS